MKQRAEVKDPTQPDAYTSPWPLRVRLLRGVWTIVYALLFRTTPKPLNAWRLMLLRLFGAKVSGRPFVSQSARVYMPWHLELRDRAAMAPESEAYTLGRVVLGARCTVAQQSYLCTGSHALEDARLPLTTAPIEVGDDVFIGMRALILPGVRLGEGCVVAAGAVVVKDVEPWTVVGGNPAKPIGRRDPAAFRASPDQTPPLEAQSGNGDLAKAHHAGATPGP